MQVPRVQVAAFRFNDLDDEPNLIGVDLRRVRNRFLRELVDEHLAIVEVAEDVLGLLQLSQRVMTAGGVSA